MLACSVRAVESGNYVTRLGKNDRTWHLTSYGCPFVLKSPDLNMYSDEVVQVDTKNEFSSALTAIGQVVIWASQCKWSMTNPEDIYEGVPAPEAMPWKRTEVIPLTLPGLPRLPNLMKESGTSRPRLIKIAQGDGFIIGLTDGGHVVAFKVGDALTWTTRAEATDSIRQREWKYVTTFNFLVHKSLTRFQLPQYCERARVQRLLSSNGESTSALSEDFAITHVSLFLAICL